MGEKVFHHIVTFAYLLMGHLRIFFIFFYQGPNRNLTLWFVKQTSNIGIRGDAASPAIDPHPDVNTCGVHFGQHLGVSILCPTTRLHRMHLLRAQHHRSPGAAARRRPSIRSTRYNLDFGRDICLARPTAREEFSTFGVTFACFQRNNDMTFAMKALDTYGNANWRLRPRGCDGGDGALPRVSAVEHCQSVVGPCAYAFAGCCWSRFRYASV